MIELLAQPNLTAKQLRLSLISRTEQISGGFQLPEAEGSERGSNWIVAPIAQGSRPALIFVYAGYRGPRMPPLPGAARDLGRVSQAVRAAGYDVRSMQDPSAAQLRHALREFSQASASSDAAIMYLTGHGVQWRGRVYVLPNDCLDVDRKTVTKTGISVGGLLRHMKARQSIIFFGGCREII